MALGTRVQFDESGGTRSTGVLAVMSERLSETIDRGVNYLLSLQASEGYWMGDLEADMNPRVRLHFLFASHQ